MPAASASNLEENRKESVGEGGLVWCSRQSPPWHQHRDMPDWRTLGLSIIQKRM